MGLFFSFILLLFSEVIFLPGSYQQQTSQSRILLQLKKQLENPNSLQAWENYVDLCNIPPSVNVSILCQDTSVTELKIMGDKVPKGDEFNGFAIPNQTLSEAFSIDSFVTTLTKLSSLRVLRLVSLGIWGPFPDKIHRLSSLELLDLSSNFMYGSVPPKISTMVKLNTLALDGNYFNGTVPDWLESLSNLTILSLKNNLLQGQLPDSVSRVETLTDISMANNKISGKLPDLSALTSLRVLDLRENQLDSKLPRLPTQLITVLLSKNSFSGDIPEHFGDLTQLQHLDLSSNNLTGAPPSALFSLPNISYLNLASNMFSGSLPDKLSCGAKLGFVDISSNRLVGGIPPCLASNSDKRFVKYNANCLSIDSNHQHHGAYCREAIKGKKPSRGIVITVLVAAISGTILFAVLLVFGVLFFRRRNHPRKPAEQQNTLPKQQENSPSVFCSELVTNATAKLGTQGAPVCRLFSYEELREATNNFDKSIFLGEGFTGKVPTKLKSAIELDVRLEKLQREKLYKGKLENGTYVTVRSLVFSKKYSIQNLKGRLDFLSKLHHPNLVALLGYCTENGGQDDNSANKVFLVYEYVPNGSYRTYLSENSPEKILKWSDRLAILIGVAKAVHFLHTGVIPGCFNNRLKTNNILLDEHRIAKLSDYGISIIREAIEKVEAKGERTKSSHKKTVEDDVYNFGFILLESLVGPIVSGKGETFLLNEMASFGSQDGRKKIVDPIVLTTSSQESLSIVVSITRKCISHDVPSRPSFEDVLWNLQYAAQVQATADADQKSDSASQA
ncbi:probable inactive leucine-rich repeat receptor-like protein kinase At3g03770 isoform X2 [Humulus lupulus]|uniref:probable inactive leucine-rich repeat receptor-like protein kinase At3g03770 isoform X2 n=1 Tax=Humulus lupulus TaxID=3486 RepID=UPI002B4175F8|nr:probable inactive leucine-rich repeat receptor-like protein kinase At3g03770 isoform X2 [Humulus lupulus]